MSVQLFRTLFAEHKKALLEDYFTFLRYPSISSEAENAQEMLKCAAWLRQYLEDSGFQTELWQTPENPTVFAQRIVDPAKPTVMIYGHYDVQPVDPLEAWTSPPFEPSIRDGDVYARGAQDDKGQIMYSIAALRAMHLAGMELPVNVKLVFEGDEECGSGGLLAILDNHQAKLAADHLIVADIGFYDIDKPSLVLGLRGVLAMTVRARGSFADMHSGLLGGVAYNPNRALAEILAKLYDHEGRVTVPGFYDEVREFSAEEKEGLSLHYFCPEEYEKNLGVKSTGGERRYSPVERVWLRPTLEINGMAGGYAGSGFKTVIPAESVAKISCRIVPDQDPLLTMERVANYIESLAPEGIEVKVERGHVGSAAVRTSRSAKIVEVAAQALTDVTGIQCRFIMEGASIHIVDALAKAAGAEPVLFGFGLPTDQIHAPNEHFGLDRIENGFTTICRILELLAAE